MLIGIAGSQGLAHAFAAKIGGNERNQTCASPGGPGVPDSREAAGDSDFLGIAKAFFKQERPGLIIVASSQQGREGLVDYLETNNFSVFGPRKRDAERIEILPMVPLPNSPNQFRISALTDGENVVILGVTRRPEKTVSVQTIALEPGIEDRCVAIIETLLKERARGLYRGFLTMLGELTASGFRVIGWRAGLESPEAQCVIPWVSLTYGGAHRSFGDTCVNIATGQKIKDYRSERSHFSACVVLESDQAGAVISGSSKAIKGGAFVMNELVTQDGDRLLTGGKGPAVTISCSAKMPSEAITRALEATRLVDFRNKRMWNDKIPMPA
jgi:phosphoribosylamine-glycine ligase